CWVNGNTVNGNAIGIVSNGNARIDDNLVYSNGTGIDCPAGGANFVARNTAHGNGNDYNIMLGNNFASVQAPLGMGFAAQPWSNFSY
ncbi:MAG: hypothetical protein NTV46_12850, partial [Verrucomicrobia bacterium]|nr:hypothetical protein [Verrucomicrobiota bacterium]